jgi:aldose 1-epimerase
MAKRHFGTLADHREVSLYRLQSKHISADISDFGGNIASIMVPDRTGKKENVVLRFDSFDGYHRNQPYLGSIVGRCCGRIATGQFDLDGETYTLSKNLGDDHLHGGMEGFHNTLWTVESASENHLHLTLQSADGTDGYPGNVSVSARYRLEETALSVEFQATTDKACPINITQHSYFNLSGQHPKSIFDHELMIDADQIVEFNEKLLPTGQFENVSQGPCDFRSSTAIGERRQEITGAGYGGGYDHCFVLSPGATSPVQVAILKDPTSGRTMELHTSQPALQFYTGNFLGQCEDKDFANHSGLCLETQGFPGAVHHPHFGGILRPGERYLHTTIYRFGLSI